MPKGPRGEKRPADVVGCAVAVAKVATGEIEDGRYKSPGRRRSGFAGAKARDEALSDERKSEIARMAARKRWRSSGEEEIDMVHGTEEVRRDDDAVLMYPDNQLGEQQREYDETQSAFSVVRERFFKQK